MRVLMVCTRIPYPLTAGFRIRIFNEAKYYRMMGHKVDLLYFGDEADEQEYRNNLCEVFNKIYRVKLAKVNIVLSVLRNSILGEMPFQISLYTNKKMLQMLMHIQGDYDVIICNHIRTGEYAKFISENKCIVDYHDAISYNYHNLVKQSKGLRKIFYKTEEKRVLKYECDLSKKIKHTVIISQEDRDYLKSHGASVEWMNVIPVAVRDDIKNRKKNYNLDEEMICFLGKMDYQPNADAVIWFADNVFPILKKKYKELQFVVIGTNPTKGIKELEKIAGVQITGFVENPYEIVVKAKAMVVPIRNGAGMQNKILESMVIGTPTVISSIAEEGLRGIRNKHYLAADKVQEYVEQLSALIDDAKLRETIGLDGQKLVNEFYTWDAMSARWEELAKEIVQ